MQKLHKNIILSSTFITALVWLYVVFSYNNLPSKIVGHMDLEGNINRLDDKNTIWILPMIFTGLQMFIYWISKRIKFKNGNLKSVDAQKTVSLFTLPYIAVILFLISILTIEKSKNTSLEVNFFFFTFIGITFVFLILLFSFIYKNLKS